MPAKLPEAWLAYVQQCECGHFCVWTSSYACECSSEFFSAKWIELSKTAARCYVPVHL